ncbi:MAG TPA: PorV/PorQ family protein [Bacteroidia bacterium]|nr:PorV/PorQ family protein [Bacteroidia bacterium]
MNKRLSILFLLLAGCGLTGIAQTRKYSNEFLNIGVGARALGMSNSYITSANDVTAGYWNPAGLALIGNQHQVALMHSEYFAGIAKYDYGAFATRLDSSSVIAASVVRFGVDDIPNTTELIDANGNVNYDRITKFSAVDFAFIVSYAKSLSIPGLRLGANAKIIRRRVGDFAGSWGFGLDAGAQYDVNKWKFAAMARDITTTFNAWSYNLSDETKQVFQTTGNEIPENSVEITLPKLLVGVARKFDFTPKLSLLAESNLDLTFDGKRNVLIRSKAVSIDPHLGLELSYMNILFLRGGLGNYQSYTDALHKKITTIQPNIGVGVRIKSFYLDYALTDIGDQSVALYSNVFSIKVDINKKVK